MNIIPSTFNEHQINCIILGGKYNDSPDALNISVVLLNSKGSHLKLHVFENLLKNNFHSIISIENDVENTSLEEISKKFPTIKFIVPLEENKVSDGELINLAMNEVKTDFVLILRDTINIPAGFLSNNLAISLLNDETYCLVPRLLNKEKVGVNMHFTPHAERNHFIIDSSNIIKDGMNTIFPYDYIGIYNRKKFIQLGGFDYTIKSSYWQNLDLAVRSWLWGEETKLTTMIQFSYIDELPCIDTTVNKDYLTYHLKNELPKIKNDEVFISKLSYFDFLLNSSCGYIEARRRFFAAKEWVEKNKFKFKKDLQMLIQDWVVQK